MTPEPLSPILSKKPLTGPGAAAGAAAGAEGDKTEDLQPQVSSLRAAVWNETQVPAGRTCGLLSMYSRVAITPARFITAVGFVGCNKAHRH